LRERLGAAFFGSHFRFGLEKDALGQGGEKGTVDLGCVGRCGKKDSEKLL
jgi:hypothetical protein